MMEIIVQNDINSPNAPTTMHHHAIFRPAISPFDCLIIRLARKPEIRAMSEPMPASETIEKIKARDNILLTLICSCRLGEMSALIIISSLF